MGPFALRIDDGRDKTSCHAVPAAETMAQQFAKAGAIDRGEQRSAANRLVVRHQTSLKVVLKLLRWREASRLLRSLENGDDRGGAMVRKIESARRD